MRTEYLSVPVGRLLRLYCCSVQAGRMFNCDPLDWNAVVRFYDGRRGAFLRKMLSEFPEGDEREYWIRSLYPGCRNPPVLELYPNPSIIVRLFLEFAPPPRVSVFMSREQAVYARTILSRLADALDKPEVPSFVTDFDKRIAYKEDLFFVGTLLKCVGRNARLWNDIAPQVEYLGAEPRERANRDIEQLLEALSV